MTAPILSVCTLGFSAVDEQILTVVCFYVTNGTPEYPTFLKSLGRLLDSTPPGDIITLLWDLNSLLDNDNKTWKGMIGRYGLPDMNLSDVQLLHFCANHSLRITSTMFEHKDVHGTWPRS